MNRPNQPLRSHDIREGNEKLVLQLIQKGGIVSQSELVETTGLKAPTILRIFTNLKDQDLIEMTDETPDRPSDKKGRKPVYYRLKSRARYVVGVEFWALSATVVISDFIGHPVYSNTIPLDRQLDGPAVLEAIAGLIETSIREKKIPRNRIIGLGIGAPGQVDTEKGVIHFYSRIKGINQINLRDFFQERLGFEVLVHNNTSVITMREARKDSDTPGLNVFSILIRGGGVGGAYMNEGRLITSGKITVLEIGHMSVEPEGRPCGCGWQGCLETYLSEEVILQDLAEKRAGSLTLEELEKLLNGDEIPAGVTEILEEKCRRLAFAIKNITNLLAPGKFLLISRSEALSRYLARGVSRVLAAIPPCPEEECPPVIPTHYDPLQAGLGACELVFNSYFNPAAAGLKG